LETGTIGFLGCGQIGRALLAGWLESGRVPPDRVLVAARRSAAATAARFGVEAADPAEVVRRADVLVLAVKPAQAKAALAGLPFREGQTLISVVAGLTKARLAEYAAPARVVRTMPSTPCRVRQGVTVVLARDERPEDVALVEHLFAAVGHVELLADEDLFHVATALVGSGPAYLFVAMEALADGAVLAGLPRETARRLAAKMVAGAAALAGEPDAHPGALKDEVASPAGTTIHALQVLERRGFRSALVDAVEAAAARSRAMMEKS
jgi:pyrroline-5-carboxylate reductase